GTNSGRKYSAAALSAFGEGDNSNAFFTGKPHVEGLGRTFLFRNYRASIAKWQTTDPLGYPDGWNQLVYCNNGVTSAVDLWGCDAASYYDVFKRYVDTIMSLNSSDVLNNITSHTIQNAGNGNFRFVKMYDRTISVLHYDWRKVNPEETRLRNGKVEYKYEMCVDDWMYEVRILQAKIVEDVDVEIWESTVAGVGIIGLAYPLLGIATSISAVGENVVKRILTIHCSEYEWIPVGLVFTRKLDSSGDFIIEHHRSTKFME
ncbi:MAG: hypothetical protein ILO34_00195, partial [Kiritimatiellae bacterium]|nr:hypothetical protein [Kiritimatiellia bacterium]